MSHESITRRDVLLGTFAAAGLAGVGTADAAEPASASGAKATAARPGIDAARVALASYVPRYLAAMNAPGLTLALADREGAAHTAAWGWSNRAARQPVRTDHLFQIGSISKSFVALAVLQLQDEGKLDVHAPVLQYLPWLPIEQPFGPITVHHLLAHTSGLQGESPLFPIGGGKLVPHYAPGVRFHYSNWAYHVLGELVAKLDGAPWPRAVERRIFAPLGMTSSVGAIGPASAARAVTSYVAATDRPYPRHGALAVAGPLTVIEGSGSIESTGGDMARYITMLLNRGAGPRGRVLSERAFEAFSTPHVAADDFGPGVHYGYGIAVEDVDGERILRHTGGMVSFMSSLQVNLDGGCGAFASINAQQGYRPNRVTRYALQCMRAARRGAAAPAVPPVAERDAPAPDAYVGTYTASDGRRVTLVAEGPQLVLVDGAKCIALDHTGGDQFVSPDPAFGEYALAFERGTPGGEAADGAPVTVLGYGETAYFHSRHTGPREDRTPQALRRLSGTYRSDNPWMGTMRVHARLGRLWAQGTTDGATPLVRVSERVFRLGDASVPDVLVFDSFVDDVPQVVWYAGVPVARAAV